VKTSELIQNTDLETRSQFKGFCQEMDIILKDYKIQSVLFLCPLKILNFFEYLTGVIPFSETSEAEILSIKTLT